MPPSGTLAVSLGRAFADESFDAEPVNVETRFGSVTLYRLFDQWLLFRHGLHHDRLPHRIPYRAQMAALVEVGVQSLVSTGTVGILRSDLPLHEPLLVKDISMPGGLLPDGTPCSMFEDGGGYLVLQEGLLSKGLGRQLRAVSTVIGDPLSLPECAVHHIAGPRGRTPAETEQLANQGVEAVSMTMVPEVVLANESGISVAAIVLGYRTMFETLSSKQVEARLAAARPQLEAVCAGFLRNGRPAPFGNSIQRFATDT